MKTSKLLTIGFTTALSACSSETATSPTAVTPQTPSALSYSVQVTVSPDSVAGRGIQSPTNVNLSFRTATGQPMDIVGATVVLKDNAGVELARQDFGPSTGLLDFRPAWSGDAIGRMIDITLEARASGQVSSTRFTIRL
jgi:hypothetical protein